MTTQELDRELVGMDERILMIVKELHELQQRVARLREAVRAQATLRALGGSR